MHNAKTCPREVDNLDALLRTEAQDPRRTLCARAVIFATALSMTLALHISVPAHAQTATGSIIGTVTDSTGAVVAGGVVSIKSLSTGLIQTRTTTPSGTY